MKKTVYSVLVFAGVMVALGLAGRYDHASEIVYNMPEDMYYSILDTLNEDPTEIAVAEEYLKNKEYYDAKYR